MYLPGPMYLLRRLVLIGLNERMTQEEKMVRGADLIGQLWMTVQKGKEFLDDKTINQIEGDGASVENTPIGTSTEAQNESDAVIEDILGKIWQLNELKQKGYWKTNAQLLELAFERLDDEARSQRIEVSNLLDLDTGEIHQAITYRPFKGLNQIPEQISYMHPILVNETGLYPGFLNRRIRWDKGVETSLGDPSTFYSKAFQLAVDLKIAIEKYKTQLKHPLAPREAVLLVRCQRIGKLQDKNSDKSNDVIVIEDGTASQPIRLAMVDRTSDYSNVANLVRAVVMFPQEPIALMIRFVWQPLTNSIQGIPLAILTPNVHLRLGI